VTGFAPPVRQERNLVEIIHQADALIASTGADIRHRGDRAVYYQLEDYIRMPNKQRFTGSTTSSPTESYYAVLLHELTHWTGHKTRLNRDLATRFHKDAYAMEELVAELGAAFLCADLGVTNSPRQDHAAYIANWLQVFKNDTKAVFTAASKASEAAAYLQKFKTPEPKVDEQPLSDADDEHAQTP
jgi:antirestriction protein ArdC